MKAFELIFSNFGQIIGKQELDPNSLRFIGNNIYQYGKRLNKNSILIQSVL
jgi:hypothetical protein